MIGRFPAFSFQSHVSCDTKIAYRFRSRVKLDEIVKNPKSSGLIGSGNQNKLKYLEADLRRNDALMGFQAFYETIKIRIGCDQ